VKAAYNPCMAEPKVNVMAACEQGYAARREGRPFQDCPYSNRKQNRPYFGWMAGWVQADREIVAQKAVDVYAMGIMPPELTSPATSETPKSGLVLVRPRI
jgi:ribosome modulation factor